jgi:hypothetical protein
MRRAVVPAQDLAAVRVLDGIKSLLYLEATIPAFRIMALSLQPRLWGI